MSTAPQVLSLQLEVVHGDLDSYIKSIDNRLYKHLEGTFNYHFAVTLKLHNLLLIETCAFAACADRMYQPHCTTSRCKHSNSSLCLA